jgi:hypothetical protein
MPAWTSHQRPVDEVFFQNEAVSLCMLINRRMRTVRVIDFRAGPSAAKRQFVLSFAQREGLEKIYTLVERDEVATWLKLGFAKEGNIPAFYKRSDAFLLGCSFPRRGPSRERDEVPSQSETRIVAARPALGAVPMTAAQERMERTITTAKKWLKDGVPRTVPQARVASAPEAIARRAVLGALRTGRATTAFEPFGRDVERNFYVITVRSGFELYASTESQACFGNVYLEILQGPRTEAERLATTGALAALNETLLSEGIVSCFALTPSDDIPLATVFLHNGFRRTGLLLEHLLLGGARRDAILWSRKLANPGDE